MTMLSETKKPAAGSRMLSTTLILLGFVVFCGVFLLLDQRYYHFLNQRFPPVGTSTGLSNLWGIVSRLHIILPALILVAWRPRMFGFQIGSIRRHIPMLAWMLLANVGVIAAYLLLTGGGTPYSGNQWLLTEIVTVPVVEETFWRGLVLTGLMILLGRHNSQKRSATLAIWVSGLGFGVLHAGNALAGVPLLFAALQALNASIWGVVYGYARVRTGSIYPAMLLHAAMNLVVVLV